MNTEDCYSELELKSNGDACFLRVSSKTKNNLISRKIRNNRKGSGVVAMDSAEQQIHSTDNSAYFKQCESGTVIFDMVLTEFVCSSCGCVLDDRILHFAWQEPEGVSQRGHLSCISELQRVLRPSRDMPSGRYIDRIASKKVQRDQGNSGYLT